MIASYKMVDMSIIDNLLQQEDDDLSEELMEVKDNPAYPSINIEKSWDGLHFLLTGKSVVIPQQDNAMSKAIIGTHLFSEEDKHDFITFNLYEELEEIISALESVNKKQLLKDFDPILFSKSKIYPDIWHTRSKEDLFNYLYETGFKPLLKFYRQAFRKGLCVIITIM